MVIYNAAESDANKAVFEVVANKPEVEIIGCTLDIYFYRSRFELDCNSATGFGRSTISVGNQSNNGRYRIATALQATDHRQKAQGVLLKFTLKLKLDNETVGLSVPKIDLQRSGLVDASGEFTDGSNLSLSIGNLRVIRS